MTHSRKPPKRTARKRSSTPGSTSLAAPRRRGSQKTSPASSSPAGLPVEPFLSTPNTSASWFHIPAIEWTVADFLHETDLLQILNTSLRCRAPCFSPLRLTNVDATGMFVTTHPITLLDRTPVLEVTLLVSKHTFTKPQWFFLWRADQRFRLLSPTWRKLTQQSRNSKKTCSPSSAR